MSQTLVPSQNQRMIDIIEQCLLNNVSAATAIKQAGYSGHAKERELDRLYKFVRKFSNGEQILEKYLKSHSAYEVHASAKLLVPRNQIDTFILTESVPLIWLVSDFTPDKRKAYSFWYNRLKKHPLWNKNKIKERKPFASNPSFFRIEPHEIQQ